MEKRRLTRRQLLGGGIALAGAAVAGGLWDNDLRLTRHTLRLPRWKANGFRIAHLADVHVNDPAKRANAQRAIRMALEAQPDLIVFTGDFVNYARPDCLDNIRAAFADLGDAKCPCLAILGNHDYSCEAPKKVVEAVRQTPLRLMINETAEVDGVRIVGLDDALHGRPDRSLTKDPQALNTLVLVHEPDAILELEPEASLVLSGHSHGGEVCLPGGTPLLTPTGSKRYTRGYYPRRKAHLFVSRGIVTLGPGRVYCPPEVALLELHGI